ncbi:D-alanine--D-alanine ligase [Chlamydiales bacterium]|nr:D-alanine--D-alanine ligase [Chlamydiales bacterium]
MHYHLIGIGGIGMSGLAKILLQMNHTVSGSDLSESPLIETLKSQGAVINHSHSPSHLPEKGTIVVSSGIKKSNPEFLAALDKKLPLIHRSDLLEFLAKKKKGLAVTGTHGKTTTTALLIETLSVAGFNPSFFLGGISNQFKTNAQSGSGDYFIYEADESDGTCTKYHPFGAIITNINTDHLDHYKDRDQIDKTFATFKKQVKGPLIEGEPLKATNIRRDHHKLIFDVGPHKDISLNSPLLHNIDNALKVLALCLSLEVPIKSIRFAFDQFSGVKRRLEVKRNEKEILFMDDYAHHPKEIASTLTSLREAYPNKRLIALFEPHRFSRMEHSLEDLPHLFDMCDHLIITDIFSCGETPLPHITPEILLAIINHPSSEYISRENLSSHIESMVYPFDLIITLGAGSITHFHQKQIPLKNKHSLSLLFGGASFEHEISLRSKEHILSGIDPELFNLSEIYIDKQGAWHMDGISSLGEIINHLKKCSIAFPVFHGPKGEDGTIQGFLELFDIPFVGPKKTACAIAMDKSITKQLFVANNLATAPFQILNYPENEVTLPFPLFIKTANSGSSVGVYRATNQEELRESLKKAYCYDHKIIVEKEIKGRELEVICIGNENPIAFPPGEILTGGQFYSYESKYGNEAFIATATPDISPSIHEEIQTIAIKTYKALGFSGMCRIDFFLTLKEELYLNEINPIPGFTSISLMPKIAKAHGYPIKKLCNHLIELGMTYHRKKQQLTHVLP